MEGDLHRLPVERDIWPSPILHRDERGESSRNTTISGKSGRGVPDFLLDPMSIAIWADVMDTSKGRDKVLVSFIAPLFL